MFTGYVGRKLTRPGPCPFGARCRWCPLLPYPDGRRHVERRSHSSLEHCDGMFEAAVGTVLTVREPNGLAALTGQYRDLGRRMRESAPV
jgi:hypothetical protein